MKPNIGDLVRLESGNPLQRQNPYQIWQTLYAACGINANNDSSTDEFVEAAEGEFCIILEVKEIQGYHPGYVTPTYCKVLLPHCIGWIDAYFLEEV